MCLERRSSSIISHTANLQEALAVTTRDLRTVVVKLAIIDIVLVLRVHTEHIVLILVALIVVLSGSLLLNVGLLGVNLLLLHLLSLHHSILLVLLRLLR